MNHTTAELLALGAVAEEELDGLREQVAKLERQVVAGKVLRERMNYMGVFLPSYYQASAQSVADYDHAMREAAEKPS